MCEAPTKTVTMSASPEDSKAPGAFLTEALKVNFISSDEKEEELMTTTEETTDDEGSRSSSSSSSSTMTSSTTAESTVAFLFDTIDEHQNHALRSFDLIASNTCCSPEVRRIMSSALMNSYCLGLPGNRFYGGCSNIDTIERKTQELVCQVFRCQYAEVQLLSGMMANIAAYNAMLPHMGCTVMASPSKHGGHYSHNSGGPLTRLFGANVVPTPWDEATYNVDIAALPLAMATHRPVLLILGWSEMLFEHDLPAIRKICDEYDCKLMYDSSHVAGLIAGGVFQKDVMEYVDILSSSTGKSLHSADHGLVLYNDPSLTPKIREAVMPLLTSNTHFHETAALAMTLLEMQQFGHEYAKQVVANTQALAKELAKRRVKLLCSDIGYSKSHELIIDLEGESGALATRELDAAGIFVNPQELPQDTATTGATGLRLGTQVLTRRGFREKDMAQVADALKASLLLLLSKNREENSHVAQLVVEKSSKFPSMAFTFKSKTSPAMNDEEEFVPIRFVL